MKKVDVLCWGIEHIAQNHGFASSVDYEEDGQVCIYGGCNIPMLQDVRFLCEDLGISTDEIESSEFGIDVFLMQDWFETEGQKEYHPTGLEMWIRYGFAIGGN